MNSISTKSLNRLREAIGNSQLGILPDVGKKHAKGYRYAIGQHADGSLARFWLGHHHAEAQHKADAYLIVWADIVATRGNRWTEERIKQAREFAERKLQLLRGFVADLRDTASMFDRFAAQQRRSAEMTLPASAPAPVAPAPTAGKPSLYDAIKSYTDGLDGK